MEIVLSNLRYEIKDVGCKLISFFLLYINFKLRWDGKERCDVVMEIMKKCKYFDEEKLLEKRWKKIVEVFLKFKFIELV